MKSKNEIRKHSPASFYFSFPQTWIAVGIIAFAALSLICAYFCNNAFWSSIFANIFAGLTTGLAICVLSGNKQIFAYTLESKKGWLTKLHQIIMDYLEEEHKLFTKSDIPPDELYTLAYDILAKANDVSLYISQSQFNKSLPFNAPKLCMQQFDFDILKELERSNDIHENLCGRASITKGEAIQLLHPGQMAIRKLNGSILQEITNIETKQRYINCSIL